MKKFMAQIINVIYHTMVYGIVVAVLGGSGLYMKSIKDEITIVKARQQESFENQANVYSQISNEINAIVFLLGSQDGLLAKRIKALQDFVDNQDELIKLKFNIAIRELQEKHNQLVSAVEKEAEKPSYEYLRSITTFHFRRVPGADKGFLGTGVIVRITEDFTYILTNKHVIDSCPDDFQCLVLTDDNDYYNVEVVKRSKSDYDMALVRIAGKIPGKQAVKGISHGTYQQKVYMVGHNLGRRYLYSEGTISGYDKKLDNSLVVGMPTAPGNSGSAVINQKGELVGLVYAGRLTNVILGGLRTPLQTMDLTHGLCVDGKIIKLFLANYL